ncbi:MAG: polyprenyl synthetase family protein [Candidatus Schekmanbacteria bacterium]|nr:polyprenyl synthetase family protein [Candidatus Schekmanbacteria bacterium]
MSAPLEPAGVAPVGAGLEALAAWTRDAVAAELARHLPRNPPASWVAETIGERFLPVDLEAVRRTVAEPIWEFLDRGGKRWRPMLMVLACAAAGGRPDWARGFLLVPEMLHNGTLMVDDVEDGSQQRRGQPAAHVLHGMDVALNAANLMYFLPMIVAGRAVEQLPHGTAALQCAVLQRISQEMLRVHFGQAQDIAWHAKPGAGATATERSGAAEMDAKIAVSEAVYLRMCALKTGSLARLAMALGALVGQAEADTVEALAELGEVMGVAFQIQDDLLNLSAAPQLGKTFGDDIAEGKLSLPVIHALRALPESRRQRLLNILAMCPTPADAIAEAVDSITASGAQQTAARVARELVAAAWSRVRQLLPESPARDRIAELAAFLVERSY